MKGPNYNFGFIRVAAATPPLRVGDIDHNLEKILAFARQADNEHTSIIVFPEMSVTAYTMGDLYFDRTLLDKARDGLEKIRTRSRNISAVVIVGLPLEVGGKLFNTAAIVFKGKIYGIVPKTYIPGYKEFYEERHFASGRDLLSKEIILAGERIAIGTDLLFRISDAPEAMLGVEICEDLWVPLPPSSFQVLAGANIIANLSASNDWVAKADYRRTLISQQSARGISAYVYSSAGVHESTADLVFGGHCVVAENGSILEESKRFERSGELIIADIDIEHLLADRERMTSFGESIHESLKRAFRIIDIPYSLKQARSTLRRIDPHPFVPKNPEERDLRAKEIFSIQVSGLAKRMEYAGIKDVVIGISGGLDSTLALLVSAKTTALLGYSLKNIHAYTMPGFGTSRRTKSNAVLLAEAMGVSIETIDIARGTSAHFKDIKQNPKKQDVTFQNAQARYRTMTLMNKANQLKALMVGTGDLSELALGWNTFSGDHISHYNVNASIPKTLVKYLVRWVADTQVDAKTRKVLKDILETPISPELVKNHRELITQKTEELIGPYELHDFFLYHFLRWGSRPRKILFLAEHAFSGLYSNREIKKWLRVFLERFFANQWKRSVMPDGPKVGSVALSPRGDWRMPSDAEVKMWLDDLR